MKFNRVKNAIVWSIITLPIAWNATAHAENNGFFNLLAESSAQRASHVGEETTDRLMQAREAIARHLENQPEDIRHLDSIAEHMAKGTVRSLKGEVTGVVGGIASDAVRSVFNLFKKPQQ